MVKANWMNLDSLNALAALERKADKASYKLTNSLRKFRLALNNPGKINQRYNVVFDSWADALNQTERLAGRVLYLSNKDSDNARYLGGSVLENTSVLVRCAEILIQICKTKKIKTPFRLIKQQEEAFSVAQELIALMSPESISAYRPKFRNIGIPTHGFDKTSKISKSVKRHTSNVIPSNQRIRILHISDLHRSKSEMVTNEELLTSLLSGLKINGDIDIDLIVVSGDLTASAKTEEYQETEEFLAKLTKAILKGNRDRCIWVPGNHDVSWDPPANKFEYNIDHSKTEKVPGKVPVRHMNGSFLPTAETRSRTMNNFRASYKRFFGKAYPKDDNQRCILKTFPNLPINILAIDTTVGMHLLNRRPDVSLHSLSVALGKAQKSKKMLIAIGHHGPTDHPNQDDSLEREVLQTLAESNVGIYLHGHVHESNSFIFSNNGIGQLPCISVGSLLVDYVHRPESTPRQYQIVDIPLIGKVGTVRIRRKDKRASAWSKDKRFGPRAQTSDKYNIAI